MRLLLLGLLVFAQVQASLHSNLLCLAAVTEVQKQLSSSTSLSTAIDNMQKVANNLPSLALTCGGQQGAQMVQKELPPACIKVLVKVAHMFESVVKLYQEDSVKNQKQILLKLTLIQTILKGPARKQCPFLKDLTQEHVMSLTEAKDKGKCAQGLYRLSLTFEQLDNDLVAGHFNNSLTDVGNIIKQLPLFFDSCNQPKLAELVRRNFPDECLGALGSLVREFASFSHHYTHLEWVWKHLHELTYSIFRVKAACPAFQQ